MMDRHLFLAHVVVTQLNNGERCSRLSNVSHGDVREVMRRIGWLVDGMVGMDDRLDQLSVFYSDGEAEIWPTTEQEKAMDQETAPAPADAN